MPVKLDLSKSVPIQPPSGVKLDLSKSVPIDQQAIPGVFSGEYSGPTGTIAPGESLTHAVARQAIGGIGSGIKGIAGAFNPVPSTERDKVSGNLTPEAKREMAISLAAPGIGLPMYRGGMAQLMEAKKAYELAKGGRYSEAAGHGLAAAVPVFGPMIAGATERAVTGTLGPAAEIATYAAAPKAVERGVPAAVNMAGKVASPVLEKVYKSNLKVPPSWKTPAEVAEITKTGLTEGIPISPRGQQKLGALIDDLNKQVSAQIKAGAESGATISREAVANRLTALKEKFKNQATPQADIEAIEKARADWEAAHPENIPVDRAQEIKVGTYRQLRGKYGELGAARVEAEKALARGIKEELEAQFPEIKNVNARESRAINLDEALERAVNRIGNRDILSLGGKVMGVGAASLFGGIEGGGATAAALVLHEVLTNPTVQSKVAIALYRGKAAPSLPAAATMVRQFTDQLPKPPAPMRGGPENPVVSMDPVKSLAPGTVPAARLKPGDFFEDTSGEGRFVVGVEGDKIKTQDGTAKTYTGEIEHQGFIPGEDLIQGGSGKSAPAKVRPEDDAASFLGVYQKSIQEAAVDPSKGIGATYSISLHRDLANEPGVSVAIPGARRAFKGDPTPKDVQQFIKENTAELSKNDRALGIWKDPDSGLTEMEVTRIHPNAESAMKAMVQGGQDAGFDLHEKRIIESARQYPPLEEFLSLAKIGESWKNWYQYAQALRPVLGERFQKFMAISAADSANTQLGVNVRETFDAYRVMREWEADPSKFKEVYKEFPGQTQLTPTIVAKLMGSELNMRNASTKAPNLFKAYTKSSVEGPKVEAYLQNLLGNFDPTVIDIYMQRAGGVTSLDVGARRAITQRVERASERLGWKNAQGQAAIWGPVRLIFDRIARRASQGGMTRAMAGDIAEALTRQEVAKHYEDVVTLILDNKGVRDAAVKFGFTEADFRNLESRRSELKVSSVKKQAYDPAVLRRIGERLYDLYWAERRIKASAEAVKSQKSLAKEEAAASERGTILPRKMSPPGGFTSSIPTTSMRGVMLNYGMRNLHQPPAPGGYNYRR